MASFNHISGAEPSTVTFKLATITQTRNSSVMHQEIMALGDPDSSNAIAAVLNAVPASTAWALAVRQVGNSSIQGNSTVFQGTSPWVIAGNCTVAPLAGSTWATRPIQSSAADLQMTATQGGTWNISSLAGIVTIAGNSSVVISGNSTAVIQGNCTVFQGTSPWIIAGNSTVAPLAGSTWATRPIQSSAADLQMTATPSAGSTWNVRALQSSAADLQATVTPAAGSTWAVRALQSSAADLQVTATPAAGSTWSVRPIQSSQADLRITAYQSTAADHLVLATIGTNLQSSGMPSSGSSGLVVRQVIDGIATFASTSALATTSASVVSSVANIRTYVTAYTITSTNQTVAHWGFFSSNATLLWPMVIASLSSAVSGANLAVAPPGYLFRTAASEALNFKSAGSTVAGVQMGVSYFQAP